ncbi:MAG: hypothetical protein ACRCX2_15585 [Paraclostridium sp.]
MVDLAMDIEKIKKEIDTIDKKYQKELELSLSVEEYYEQLYACKIHIANLSHKTQSFMNLYIKEMEEILDKYCDEFNIGEPAFFLQFGTKVCSTR